MPLYIVLLAFEPFLSYRVLDYNI